MIERVVAQSFEMPKTNLKNKVSYLKFIFWNFFDVKLFIRLSWLTTSLSILLLSSISILLLSCSFKEHSHVFFNLFSYLFL